MSLNGSEPSVDFVNTSGKRSAGAAERLNAYQDLVDWALEVGILDKEQSQHLADCAAQNRAAAERALRQALDLREAIYEVFSAAADVSPVCDEALEIVNASAAEMLQHLRIRPVDNGFRWLWHDIHSALSFPRWAVARSAALLLVSEQVSRIGRCQARGCERLFIDATCNKSRRWCDMATCGNREKVRQFRARQRSQS